MNAETSPDLRCRWRRAGTSSVLSLWVWLMVASCAALPASGDDEISRTSQNTTTILPTVPGLGAKPGDSATAPPPTQSTLGGTGKAASFPGVSLRWHANKTRCLSRTAATPTLNDPIVMAACASDARQAFSISAVGFVGAGGNLCLGQAQSASALSLCDCSNNNEKLFIIFTPNGSASWLSGAVGPIVPADLEGTPGTAVGVMPGTTASANSVWDFVGVGNQGGTAWGLSDGATTSACLTVAGTTSAVARCNPSAAEQRWRLDGGVLVNDTGKCLACDVRSLDCALRECAAITQQAPEDQRWSIFLSVQYATQNGNTSFSLSGNQTTGRASIRSEGAALWNIGQPLP